MRKGRWSIERMKAGIRSIQYLFYDGRPRFFALHMKCKPDRARNKDFEQKKK